MQARELQRLLKSKKPPKLLDVRSGMEFRTGHIPGAEHLPFWKVIFRLARLPDNKETHIIVLCESGARAELAISMLSKRGYCRLESLEGDMINWRRAGFEMVKGA